MRFSPLPYLRKYIRNKLKTKVFSGPYQGMIFEEAPGIDCYETKLMGTYEKELYPTILEIVQKGQQSLTVIGAAEGYHAIGLGRLTGLPPVCFESDVRSFKNLVRHAEENHVDIEMKGLFSIETFFSPLPGLIFMDIEGMEAQVLSRDRLHAWSKQHLIIEIHGESIRQAILQSCEQFFKTVWISSKARTVKDYPFPVPFKHLLKRWWQVPIQEWRSESIGWLVLYPLSEGS